jgi:hypothetical protein
MTFGQPHTDSASGHQWHVRYRILAHGPHAKPFWSYVADVEADALEQLAMLQRDAGLADVELWVRDTTPWRKA